MIRFSLPVRPEWSDARTIAPSRPSAEPPAVRAEPHTVLVVHRGGDQVRGSEEALLTLLKSLDRDELRPVVVCSHSVLRAALAARGIECVVAELPEVMLSRGDVRLPAAGYLRAIWRLAAIARGHRAELLLCSGGGPCQLGVPVAAWLGKPVMCLLHHPAPANYHAFWLTRFVRAMVCTSEFTAAHTRARIGGTTEVAHIGIDVERFAPRAPDAHMRRSFGMGPEDVVFAQVGALVPSKGHRLLLKAFERVAAALPNARLLVIGGGPESASLQEQVRERGLSDRVQLTGYVADARSFFRHVIDVNVLASEEEGLGLVNLEASACELPAIGTDATGIRETIVHGRTGYLFPPGDEEALATCMIRLGRDAELRYTLGRQGRQFVVSEFSVASYGERVQQVMRQCMRRSPGRA